MAGANFYDTLFESVYSRGVTKPTSAEREQIKQLLDFTAEFSTCDNSNVYPLLARNDRIVRYEVQKESYGSCPVATFDKGHVTGALAADTIRDHIFSSI